MAEPFLPESVENLMVWFNENNLMIICPFAAFDRVGPIIMTLFGFGLVTVLYLLISL